MSANCSKERPGSSRLMQTSLPPANLAAIDDKNGGALINKPVRQRPPPWAELPFEITANILQRLGVVEILVTAQYVCKSWHSVCIDPSMWQVIKFRKTSVIHSFWQILTSTSGIDSYMCMMDKIAINICRFAIDLSKGMLVDIRIQYFACDTLLAYIAGRSSHKLRRLRLHYCYNFTDEDVIKAIKRLPNLEEFCFYRGYSSDISISSETVKTIGESCPLLRSFAFNRDAPGSEYRYGPLIKSCDEVAYAIARSMPKLRHLELQGNGLTDEGLKAILDGCPHLETLDLAQCIHAKLKGDLRERCSSQIKCLTWKEFDFELFEKFHDLQCTKDLSNSDMTQRVSVLDMV